VFNIGQEKSIWIVGSSIIKWAFQRACNSAEKTHLGLQRKNYHILWQGKGGLTWDKLFPRIQLLLRYEPSPNILIIHCGGNDIGNVPLLDLRMKMKETFHRIQTKLPQTILGWSHILPRYTWRYSKNIKSQNLAAKRINSFMSSLFVQNDGFYISYPEIAWNSYGLFKKDGVHLNELGNDILLYNLQSKLQEVCYSNGERWARSMY
jgi:lysophospholipase L1-like esterase